MAKARSLVVQSILYGNQPRAVRVAAEAVANSCRRAVAGGFITSWVYAVGDCSESPALHGDQTAGLRNLITESGGEFAYSFFDQNLGSAGGHNRLAASGDSELIMILNPDAVVDPDAVATLVVEMGPAVGIAEARQIPLEHPKEYASPAGDTGWASTACAITSRRFFDRLGGFDEATFFLYCDDVDYSWRMRLEGMRVVYVPAARVFHDKRLTVTGDWPASTAEVYYSAEAALLLAAKYSRPDIVDELLPIYLSQGGPVAAAAEEYLRRRAAGSLAASVDPEHRVGQFVDGNYTRHRF